MPVYIHKDIQIVLPTSENEVAMTRRRGQALISWLEAAKTVPRGQRPKSHRLWWFSHFQWASDGKTWNVWGSWKFIELYTLPTFWTVFWGYFWSWNLFIYVTKKPRFSYGFWNSSPENGRSQFFLKPNNLDSMGSRRFLLWLLVVWTAPGTGCLCRAAGWKFCIVRGPVEDPQSCGGSNNTRHSAKRWGFSRVIFQGGEQNMQNISFTQKGIQFPMIAAFLRFF